MNATTLRAVFNGCFRALEVLLEIKQPWLNQHIRRDLLKAFRSLDEAIKKASAAKPDTFPSLMAIRHQLTTSWNEIVHVFLISMRAGQYLQCTNVGQDFGLMLATLKGQIDHFLHFKKENIPQEVKAILAHYRDPGRYQWRWISTAVRRVWELYGLKAEDAGSVQHARLEAARQRYGLQSGGGEAELYEAIARMRFITQCRTFGLDPERAGKEELFASCVEWHMKNARERLVPLTRATLAEQRLQDFLKPLSYAGSSAKTWADLHQIWFWDDCFYLRLYADEATPLDIDRIVFERICTLADLDPNSTTWFMLNELPVDLLDADLKYAHLYWATPIPDDLYGVNDLDGLV